MTISAPAARRSRSRNTRPSTTWRSAPISSLPYPESDAKNLFVRDDKRRSYYLHHRAR